MNTSFRNFVILWIGQLCSVLGTGITQFSLGVWILKETGSVTQFAMIMMAASLPGILIAPFAGVVVDRWNRKWIMVISDCMAGLSTLAIFILYSFNALEVWHLFITAAIATMFNSFQMPAYQASIPMLVPKEKLDKANGMVQLTEALSIVIAPMLAGFLFYAIDLNGILIIDFATFFVAITTLLCIKFPALPSKGSSEVEEKTSFFKEALFGWEFIMKRPGLKGFLLYFAIVNLLLGFFNVLLQPLILSFSDEKMLGISLSLAGIGMLVGGATMSIWGAPKNRVLTVLGTGFVGGIFLSIAGLKESILLITLGVFFVFVMIPVGNAASQSIWQRKVPLHVQGRVFSLRRMIAVSLQPIAFISAGPLVGWLAPQMEEGGSLSGLFGKLVGMGDGRAIGLLFVLLGVLWSLTSILLYFNPRVRKLEGELPDVLEDRAVENEGIAVTTQA
ncbi:MFS transporter [Bacillus carboniphilus]|uniref:MFS transporter n=1 Tax=Bacillus carboniphilus TaxID=86663 RepID=A0ABP3FW11_9BACI